MYKILRRFLRLLSMIRGRAAPVPTNVSLSNPPTDFYRCMYFLSAVDLLGIVLQLNKIVSIIFLIK